MVNQKGISAVEALLIIPLMLLIVLFGIEYARCMSLYSRLTAFSREAIVAAFRDCSANGYISLTGQDPDALKAAVESCFKDLIETKMAAATAIIPGREVILSLYRYKKDENPKALAFGQYKTSGAGESEIRREDYFSEASRITLLNNHQVLLFAETILPYQPLIPFVARSFGLRDGRFYVLAVL